MITLTTDFGYTDPFAGVMKGVILSINPSETIVDLTHGIEPHDIQGASIILSESYRYFPKGTIHVAVVDPGVGSMRRRIVVQSDGHLFVGPDNGVFTSVLLCNPESSAVTVVTDEELFLSGHGGTFDGRDVFAPLAAALSLGQEPGDLGTSVTDHVLLNIPAPELNGAEIRGEVLYIDRFGNGITNIGMDLVELLGEPGGLVLEVEGWSSPIPMAGAYSERLGGPGVLINSSGKIEIFVYGASAANVLGLRKGSGVVLSSRRSNTIARR